jgi:hypothetical protein
MNLASAMQSEKKIGGREGIRTPDPLLAKQVLSQLSYTPPNRRSPDLGIWILHDALVLLGLTLLEFSNVGRTEFKFGNRNGPDKNPLSH